MRTKLLSLVAAIIAVGVGTASTARAAMVYGVTTNNVLFNFDSATPGTLLSGLAIA